MDSTARISSVGSDVVAATHVTGHVAVSSLNASGTSRPLNMIGLFSVLFLIGLAAALYWGNPFVTDRPPHGDSQTAAGPPQRIICMAPNITETLFALGAGEHVVGVADYTTYPPQAAAIQRVGGFIDPNFEKLAILEPDLIIIQGEHDRVHTFCRRYSIPYLSVNMDSIDSIKKGIRDIGRAIGRDDRAELLVDTIEQQLEIVRNTVKDSPRPRVFLSLGRRPGSLSGLFTTGNSGFLGELLDIAGGDNIFADLTAFYPQVSKEALVLRAPEIIIEAMYDLPRTDELQALAIKDWQSLDMLPAVRQGRIVVLTETFFQVPGPRIGESARLLAGILHPSPLFAEKDGDSQQTPSTID